MKAEDYPWMHGLHVREKYSGVLGIVTGIATYAHSAMEIQVIREGLDADGQPYVPKWWPADQLQVINAST